MKKQSEILGYCINEECSKSREIVLILAAMSRASSLATVQDLGNKRELTCDQCGDSLHFCPHHY
ncbi:hypothetical protein [Tumebacillus permanentifrigoris]|uniref:hypothetical protein n=1 Tax=Tumebacillus permanentifrigoris TaxID=378543 RepID=UPI0011B21952|nr:hypothetical protein [Tumebacillus permanentifrigoris]